MDTVVIHRAMLHAVADDPADALHVLRATESVLSLALKTAGASVGDEVLVLRRVDIRFAVHLDGPPGPIDEPIERALSRALTTLIASARRAGLHPWITDDVAWFPSEAAAVAGYLAALSEGSTASFPYRAMTVWGASWPEVLRTCLARGRALLGGVLAYTLERIGPDALVRQVPDDLATALVRAWTEGLDEKPLAVAALPREVRAALAIGLEHESRHALSQRHLLVLARLFAKWPPARDLRVPIAELQRLVGEIPELRRLTGTTIFAPEPMRSAAGGLLAWAALLDLTGLSAALLNAYPETRHHNAVRWVIGRALEDPRMSGADPLLLLWSSEDPTALVEPTLALEAAGPEPLHRLAVRAACDHHWLEAPLEAMPMGDAVALMGDDGICVDAILAPDVHAAVPELVRRFSLRSGAPPAGIRIAERLGNAAIDALLEVDVASLPDGWRVAARAFASLARSLLHRMWSARARDARGWPVVVTPGDEITVDVRRSDTSRIDAGSWVREDFPFGGRNIRIRVK